MSQNISLNLDNVDKLAAIGKALSSDVRIELLKLLCHCSLNVNEIADLENYLWLFTKNWASVYEVYDKNNKMSLQIIGETFEYAPEFNYIINGILMRYEKYPDLKLLLVPRHTTRLPQITPIIDSLDLNYGFRSKEDTFKDKDIVILDTMGELSKMYSICSFAFIGGSFNKTGGHNPLEATVYSKPTITICIFTISSSTISKR